MICFSAQRGHVGQDLGQGHLTDGQGQEVQADSDGNLRKANTETEISFSFQFVFHRVNMYFIYCSVFNFALLVLV